MYPNTFLLLSGATAFASLSVQAHDASTFTLSFNHTSTATSVPTLTAPGNCEPLPYGRGILPLVDTPDGFLNDSVFFSLALGAETPMTYTRVYVNRHGATRSGEHLGHNELDKYDVNECARRCDQTKDCEAFNIYLERTPDLNVGPNCTTSLSSTTVKCTFWGNRLNETDEMTESYWRWDFEVVVAASNAYNRKPGAMRSIAVSVQNPLILAVAVFTVLALWLTVR
jgi:hypothetical protein